jgi:hypothetical protein
MSREDGCLSYDILVVHSLNAATLLPTHVAERSERELRTLDSRFSQFQQTKKIEP